MNEFAKLLEDLIFSPSRKKKISLIVNYFKNTFDTEKGYALSILTSNFKFLKIRNIDLKKMVYSRIDRELFDLSYDYVGDTAETISLIWRKSKTIKKKKLPSLTYFVKNTEKLNRNQLISYIIDILDSADVTERWAFIKILSGGLRVGVSNKLVKIALAEYGEKKVELIEKIWHGLEPPYIQLFNWLDNKSKQPAIDVLSTFHPMMLSHPIDENKDFIKMNSSDFCAEWKWDGIRVQIIIAKNKTVIFSRNGDNITNSFPDLKYKSNFDVVIDGELLVGENCTPTTFNNLQQRLNRKKVTKNHMDMFPAFLKAYDILFIDNVDLRDENFMKRRNVLEKWIDSNNQEKIEISSLINFKDWKELKKIKQSGIKRFSYYEGLMLKLKESKYLSGRPRGFWFKWKRDPNFLDAVLMYAQRGHGKRSSYYSDFTFGVWNGKDLVPVGKAYTGFTNEELDQLDKFVRKNTLKKFGPVRETEKKIVFEIAFDSISVSKRHKSGIALRFPRINKIRWDKPVSEVENLECIKKFYNLDKS